MSVLVVLFKDHPELSEGFSIFLPPGFGIQRTANVIEDTVTVTTPVGDFSESILKYWNLPTLHLLLEEAPATQLSEHVEAGGDMN